MIQATIDRIERGVPPTAEQMERTEIDRAVAHADATTVMSGHQNRLNEWLTEGRAQQKLEKAGDAPAPVLELDATPGETSPAFRDAMRRAEANVRIGEPETVGPRAGDGMPEANEIAWAPTGTKIIGVVPDAGLKERKPQTGAEAYAAAMGL